MRRVPLAARERSAAGLLRAPAPAGCESGAQGTGSAARASAKELWDRRRSEVMP